MRSWIKILISIILVSTILLSIYYFAIYNNNSTSSVSYPEVKPYTKKYSPGDFPLSVDEAIKRAKEFLKNEYGLEPGSYKIVRQRVGTRHYGIKYANIYLEINTSSGELIFLLMDLNNGSIVFLSAENLAPTVCPAGPMELSEDYVKNLVKTGLIRLSYHPDGADVKILGFHTGSFSKWVRVHFALVIHGYMVLPVQADGYMNFCPLSNDEYKFYYAVVPGYVFYVYREGLFIKPPDPLPVSKDDAIRLAVNYVKSTQQVVEYRYQYVGVFWTFHKWNNTDYYDPVPHLEHYITFWVSVKGGGQYNYNVTVDAIAGEVYGP